MAKDKYEISLWEDKIDSNTNQYVEEKIAVIGSNTMTAPCRAINPVLKENINGTSTFTFEMVNHYIDENGERQGNPFLNLLVNERRIKVLWKEKWYEFVIKTCTENNNNGTFSYSCSDLFINELSKTGFNLNFNTELENNTGTVTELASTILEGSDWTLDTTRCDTIQQLEEDAVYEVSISTTNSLSAKNQTQGSDLPVSVSGNILVFFRQIQEIFEKIHDGATSGNKEIQFLYAENYIREGNSQLVINGDCYITYDPNNPNNPLTWSVNNNNISFGGKFTIPVDGAPSSQYRAKRLVQSQQCVLDPVVGAYCDIFSAKSDGTGDYAGLISQGDILHRFIQIDYSDPTSVTNLVINSSDFYDRTGWNGIYQADKTEFVPAIRMIPEFNAGDYDDNSHSYLVLEPNTIMYNAFLQQGGESLPDGFKKGEKYIFRYSGGYSSQSQFVEGIPSNSDYWYEADICDYTISNGKIIPDDTGGSFIRNKYFSISQGVRTDNNTWLEYELTCKKSITYEQLLSQRIGLFIFSKTHTLYAKDVQFFKYTKGSNSSGAIVRINPGELNIESVLQTNYYYFNKTKFQNVKDKNEIAYLYYGENDWDYDGKDPVYNESFAKIRSITAERSNRFNLLQTLAETFECWVCFDIDHNENGTIKKTNGALDKKIYFKKDIGADSGLTFVYGIDLKSITRTIESNQIVTKTVVSANNNEFGEDGYCTIGRSKLNYPRTDFILNFDYYINHGLINASNLYADLYKTGEVAPIFTKNSETNEYTFQEIDRITNPNIHYYYQLNLLYREYETLTKELINKEDNLLNLESENIILNSRIPAINNELVEIEGELIDLADAANYSNAEDFLKENSEKTEIKTRVQSKNNLLQERAKAEEKYTASTERIESLKTEIGTLESNINLFIENIGKMHDAFEKKYSHFIQEGSWISEDYYDDDQYYLDAQSVAYTSSRPQVSYSISVARLSSLEDFKHKVFHLGDIGYIQDTDFFGYVYVGNIKTPYKEKILISEITSNFDQPWNDTLTVQNYKTQFEDLFQRITATTQTLQFTSGEYGRAAAIMDANGNIKSDVLQNSINENTTFTLSGYKNTISFTQTGLRLHSTESANNVVELNGQGLFISKDGGETFINAISAGGINTNVLLLGNINTEEIIIGQESAPSFRWDSLGINAYDHMEPEPGQSADDVTINPQKFVRFDRFGLYGVDLGTESLAYYEPEDEDEIWSTARFGLTWRGFFLKSDGNAGYVSISSDGDFQVFQYIEDSISGDITTLERIKIGRISADGALEPVYGIRINDDNGNSVFVTDEEGNISITGEINATGGNFSELVTVGYDESEPYIIIDGRKDGLYPVSIHSSNYGGDGATTGWIINKDGDAVFNNITARGAIRTCVFEYAEIQAVGGIFLFRPSAEIKDARIGGSQNQDLIVKVDKPLLFAKLSYTEVQNVTQNDNPKESGWYEKTNYGYIETEDTQPVSGKKYYTQSPLEEGSWCKVSNYIADGVPTDVTIQSILLNNGLTHVYQITHVDTNSKEVTLAGGAAMVGSGGVVSTVEELRGGALIDMGRTDNSSNYGIGINSSDNSVNLPARAISLFETAINPSASVKVTYNYKGILGTLPNLDQNMVDDSIYQYLAGTQGIFTNNMYIGDQDNYLSFYTDENNEKKLKIKASSIFFEVSGDEYKQVSELKDGEDAVQVRVDSNIGNMFIKGATNSATLTCTVLKGDSDITSSVTKFTWTKKNKDGTDDTSWNAAHNPTSYPIYNSSSINILSSEVSAKAIFICTVEY